MKREPAQHHLPNPQLFTTALSEKTEKTTLRAEGIPLSSIVNLWFKLWSQRGSGQKEGKNRGESGRQTRHGSRSICCKQRRKPRGGAPKGQPRSQREKGLGEDSNVLKGGKGREISPLAIGAVSNIERGTVCHSV